MDAKDTRENYFLLLDLDPEAPWDDAALTAAIGRCRKRWTREAEGVGHKPKTIAAKENLRGVPALQRTMHDPEARERERRAALLARAAREQQRRRELSRTIDIRLAKGYLYDVEVTDLRAGDVLAAHPDLRRRVDTAEVRPMRPATAADVERLAAEPSLNAALATLRAKNLYEVLKDYDKGITPKSPRERLLDAADKLYLDGNSSSRKDAAVEAKQTLGGIAKSAFATESERAKHDNSMRLRVLDELIATYEAALAAVRVVHGHQVRRFLSDARSQDIDVDEARDHLVAHFTARKWQVELPSEEDSRAAREEVACPGCSTTNPPGRASCTVCGLALREPCPACQQIVPTAAGCGRCGFPTGERGWVFTLLEYADKAVRGYDLATAADLLATAEGIWRLPADRVDAVTERIAGVRSRLAEKSDEVKEILATVGRAMEAGHHQEALRRLEALPEAVPDRAPLLAETRRHVTAADELCRRSRVPGTADPERVRLLTEALRECADHAEARREIARVPPAAPGGLAAEMDAEAPSVTLTWTPSGEREVRYVVVRTTSDRIPTSIEGGRHQQRMEIVAGTRWEDRTPVLGTPLRYAVFAERAGTVSDTPAVTSQAVYVMGEADVAATPRDGGADLEWTLPAGADDAEIHRERVDGAEPARPPAAHGGRRLADRDLRNGVRYRYTVRARYRDRSVPGGVRRSAGRSVDVVPHRVPTPPGPVEAAGTPPPESMPFYRHLVTLRWPRASEGTVHVVRFDGPVDLRAGDQVPEAALENHGYVLSGEPPVRDMWTGKLRCCQYVPALVVEGIAYIGHARPYAALDEVGEPCVVRIGSTLLLRWAWPAGADSAVVAPGRIGAAAGLFDAAATTVARRAGAATGELDLGPDLGPGGPLLVAAGLVVGGVRHLTTGREVPVDDEVIIDVPVPRRSGPRGTPTGAADDPGSGWRRRFSKRTGST